MRLSRLLTGVALTMAVTASITIVASGPAHANIPVCKGTWTIQANNGLYVANEENLDNMLRARTPASQIGSWERFRLFEHAIQDNHKVYAVQASNGKFVMLENNFSPYPFRLVAAFEWSTPYNYPHDQTFAFSREDQPPPNGGNTGFGSLTNALWVTNEEQGYGGAYPGMLRARTPFSQRGAWENFIWRRVSTSCL